MQVLAHEDKRRSGAALKCMKLFVTTLLEVAHAQRRLHMARLAAAVDGEGEPGKSPGPGDDAAKSPSPRPDPSVKVTPSLVTHPVLSPSKTRLFRWHENLGWNVRC